jgi:hypothetical protein
MKARSKSNLVDSGSPLDLPGVPVAFPVPCPFCRHLYAKVMRRKFLQSRGLFGAGSSSWAVYPLRSSSKGKA